MEEIILVCPNRDKNKDDSYWIEKHSNNGDITYATRIEGGSVGFDQGDSIDLTLEQALMFINSLKISFYKTRTRFDTKKEIVFLDFAIVGAL